eukprot:TRINITY_DN66112_c4_g1_i1.p1 TRINITY_DN66112_c4_g1~~TRINITY_DN66112_c4_g1_i1.p1  ORF type:complete len:376 (-),score=163.29 TRINITY_DN66112_c4_g1_i1:119-1246(-)
MDAIASLPVSSAHRFSRLAAAAEAKGHWQQAIYNHRKAAEQFGLCAKLTGEESALHQLELLQDEHERVVERIRRELESASLSSPSLTDSHNSSNSSNSSSNSRGSRKRRRRLIEPDGTVGMNIAAMYASPAIYAQRQEIWQQKRQLEQERQQLRLMLEAAGSSLSQQQQQQQQQQQHMQPSQAVLDSVRRLEVAVIGLGQSASKNYKSASVLLKAGAKQSGTDVRTLHGVRIDAKSNKVDELRLMVKALVKHSDKMRAQLVSATKQMLLVQKEFTVSVAALKKQYLAQFAADTSGNADPSSSAAPAMKATGAGSQAHNEEIARLHKQLERMKQQYMAERELRQKQAKALHVSQQKWKALKENVKRKHQRHAMNKS